MHPEEVFSSSSHENLGSPAIQKQLLMDLALPDVDFLLAFLFGNFIEGNSINHFLPLHHLHAIKAFSLFGDLPGHFAVFSDDL